LKKVLPKNIGFEFEIASNINNRTMINRFNKFTGWKARIGSDCSIESDGMKYAAEIRTPPVPASQAISRLKRACKFFQENEVTTNYSTGLHVNISFRKSGYNFDIDGTKLQVLVDDLKWLKRFDRLENEYCESPKISLNEMICDYQTFLRRRRLEKQATVEDYLEYISNVIEEGDTELLEKYCAVNVGKLEYKNPYVEFRVIGGENYHWRFEHIQRAINDFSRSMDMSLGTKYNYLMKRFIKNMAGLNDHKPVSIIPH